MFFKNVIVLIFLLTEFDESELELEVELSESVSDSMIRRENYPGV